MKHNHIKAKRELLTGNYTCVLCRGKEIHTSYQRGVKPLVEIVESGRDFKGFSAADKVVGKATAFLYLVLGVTSIYASVISRSALKLLEDNDITVEYDTLAENIINRQENGICPFEAAVLDIENIDEAYDAIRSKMRELNII